MEGGFVSDCVFCQISRGEAPAEILRANEEHLVIVPLNPVTEGHVLVIPRIHVVDAAENLNITGRIMEWAGHWVATKTNLSANIITSIGPEATQTVFHFHVHVVPRRKGDGLALPWTVKS